MFMRTVCRMGGHGGDSTLYSGCLWIVDAGQPGASGGCEWM